MRAFCTIIKSNQPLFPLKPLKALCARRFLANSVSGSNFVPPVKNEGTKTPFSHNNSEVSGKKGQNVIPSSYPETTIPSHITLKDDKKTGIVTSAGSTSGAVESPATTVTATIFTGAKLVSSTAFCQNDRRTISSVDKALSVEAQMADSGPLRPTGFWSITEIVDEKTKTINFAQIDTVESDIAELLAGGDNALIAFDDEEKWKHKLMFNYRFKKTPKHLTWKELGQEIECVDCVIKLDEHRPEERFRIEFLFINKRNNQRDIIWMAENDVSVSEGFTDLLAAIGSCLGRSDVFRTIRFDDGLGTMRDLVIQKRSKMTSDILLSFRPPVWYNVYDRKGELDANEEEAMKAGASLWGFHPQIMDPEYRDDVNPEGTYSLALSAHAFSFIMLRSIERLISKPIHEFYRSSQIAKTAKVKPVEHIGLSDAMKGWLGFDDAIYQHYTPIEAIQNHWLGADAPFTLTMIIVKLREMTYLKKKNPEFYSWLSVRKHDTALALRNIRVKLLGVGASTLFLPHWHKPTINRLLPKAEHRMIKSHISINALLDLPDETRRMSEFKKLTGRGSAPVIGGEGGYARISGRESENMEEGEVSKVI